MIFQNNPLRIKIAKIVVTVTCLLFSILVILDCIDVWTDKLFTLTWWGWTSAVVVLLLNTVLVLITLFEVKLALLISLIVLGVFLIPEVVSFNVLALYVVVKEAGKMAAKSVDERTFIMVASAVFVEFVTFVYFAFLAARFYGMLKVYQWTKVPRVTTTVTTTSRPQITVRTDGLP